MANKIWVGSSLAVAQVSTFTVGGTVEIGDLFLVTINGKAVSVASTTTSTSTTATEIKTALAASTITEFLEVTWTVSGSVVTGTATTAGKPFTATASTTEAGGGAADLQTFVAATSTASSGPNDWSAPANWNTGTVPITGDAVFLENSNVSILYGLAQSAVTLASLNHAASYTGSVGLPRYTAANGYAEYRSRYLAIGATAFNYHTGAGTGSPRFNINFGSVQCTGNIYGTGRSSEQGIEPLLILGTHASNEFNFNKGTAGFAMYAGETATINILRSGFVTNAVGDVSIRLGSGVTIGTRLDMAGGTVVANAAVPIVNMTDGIFSLIGTGGITTVNGDGGSFFFQSTGTIGTLNVGDGFKADFSKDMRSRTITNCNLYSGFSLIDSFETCTFTNPFALVRCGLADGTLDLGVGFHLLPSA